MFQRTVWTIIERMFVLDPVFFFKKALIKAY
jgi:hypothetical protein